MRIHNAIICDQVRKEDSGKHLLLGVYPIDILVPDFPSTIALVLWMQLYVDRNGAFDVEFRIQKDKKIINRSKATISVKDHLHPATISLPPALIEIDGECTLSFQIREKNKRWKTAKELPVKKLPNSN